MKALTSGLARLDAVRLLNWDSLDSPTRWLKTVGDMADCRRQRRSSILDPYSSLYFLILLFFLRSFTLSCGSWCFEVATNSGARWCKVSGREYRNELKYVDYVYSVFFLI